MRNRSSKPDQESWAIPQQVQRQEYQEYVRRFQNDPASILEAEVDQCYREKVIQWCGAGLNDAQTQMFGQEPGKRQSSAS